MANTIITDNLYNRILIDPVKHDPSIDRLLVVSGYSTAAMAFHHLDELPNIKIELICGMTTTDGLSLSNHKGFCKLVTDDYNDRFSCSYIYKGHPVHSKLYIWLTHDTPKFAFIGSANYTQNAMRFERQRETMALCNPPSAYSYFKALIDDTIYCNHGDVSDYICLYADEKRKVNVPNLVTRNSFCKECI